MEDGTGLLRRELETLWRLDGRGRIAGLRTSDPGPLPWVVVAAAAGRPVVWACAAELDDAVAGEVDALLRRGAPVGGLVERVPPGRVHEGPSFAGPPARERAGRGVECWTGASAADRARLEGRMPEPDRVALVEPWVVAVVDGTVGAVCETARDAPEVGGAEAGVWTYEAFRRRGLATAAVAAWMDVQAERGRTAFYSTSAGNLASQGVARRLGLRPLGWWWSVRP